MDPVKQLTLDEAIQKLREKLEEIAARNRSDYEMLHIEADKATEQFFREIGHPDIAEKHGDMAVWFA